MAGDWIKIETNLTEKPEVLAIANRLMMNRFEVAGRLFRLWSWFDSHSENGHAPGVTSVTLDEVICCDGLGEALKAVGWMIEDREGICLPRFDRHNGNPAKSRAQANRRQKASRAKHDNGHADSVTKALPEKRREEHIKSASRSMERSASVSDDLPVTKTTQQELERLAKHVRHLRSGWKLPFTHAEERLLFESMATLDALEPEDWRVLKEYLHARIPQGVPKWQPESRSRFLQDVADVWSHAERWNRKRQEARPKAAAPAPEPPPQSEEDKKALAEFLGKSPTKASN